MTNQERIDLRERSLRLSIEIRNPYSGPAAMYMWAEHIYKFLSSDGLSLHEAEHMAKVVSLMDSGISGPKKSRNEIDWSRPQLVKYSNDFRHIILETNGIHDGVKFEAKVVDANYKSGFILGERKSDWVKSAFEYHGEIPEKIPEETTVMTSNITRRVYVYPNGDESNTIYVSRLDRPELYDAYNNGEKCSWYIEDYIKKLDVKPVLLPHFIIDGEVPKDTDSTTIRHSTPLTGVDQNGYAYQRDGIWCAWEPLENAGQKQKTENIVDRVLTGQQAFGTGYKQSWADKPFLRK